MLVQFEQISTEKQDHGLPPRQAEAGEYDFLVGCAIDEATLRKAIDLGHEWGVAPHLALIAVGWVSLSRYVDLLATHLGLKSGPEAAAGPLRHAKVVLLDATLGRPGEIAAAAHAHAVEGREVILISTDDLIRIETAEDRALRSERAIAGLLRARPGLSAGTPVWLWQLLVGVIVAGLFVGCAGIAPDVAQDLVLLALAMGFLPVSIMRALTLALTAWPPRRRPEETEVADADLPVYSVLVPLFREGAVLPDLVRALSALDYPRAKLDVLIVLEAVDQETQRVAAELDLPGFMRVIVVPDSLPRTKPKALNYALQFARGSYVVVYDAEDVPEQDQLRRAVRAFRTASSDTYCLQARLNIHNAEDAWLTRQFALEYSVLFDLTLPVLAKLGLPVPLGGTSNHFPRHVLERWTGWDPFNVTEDADLGVRLARTGGRIAMLDSTTWEEAPTRFAAWLPQRTRWLKGWFQTYLVHTRRPSRLWRDLGATAFIGFHAYSGGLLLSALVFPWFLGMALLGLMSGTLSLWPPSAYDPLWLLAIFNLVVSLTSSALLGAIAAARRGRRGLISNIVSMPIYWLLISFAAYRALLQLSFAPYHWEKTEHRARKRDPIYGHI